MESVETICAVSTPPGEGGIGVLRLSGPLAHTILRKIFKTGRDRKEFLPRRLYLGHITDPRTSEHIDEVFAVFMDAPRTYTREDMGEVYSHGGFAVQRKILSLMIEGGARLAEAGEFTKRAFLNGRIDLLQAESVRDIIESETEEELKQAVGALQGTLSRTIESVKADLKGALVEVEAMIDFPEEEIDIDEEALLAAVERAITGIQTLADSYYEGNAIRHGLQVLIVGRTNVGKSSLLNALLARERAIVTPLPGTTRDMIEDIIHIHGIKLRIIDTAGMGVARDIVETEGIERVKRKIPEADLLLWIIDGSRPYSTEDEKVWEEIKDAPRLVVVNKADLPQAVDPETLRLKGLSWMEVSALRDEGTEGLKEAIYEALMGTKPRGGATLVTNVRHVQALSQALPAAKQAAEGLKSGTTPLEFIALDLRESLLHLGEITGETWTDDILHEIFNRFCIGK